MNSGYNNVWTVALLAVILGASLMMLVISLSGVEPTKYQSRPLPQTEVN